MRGPRNHLLTVRLAGEGVPIRAIARVLKVAPPEVAKIVKAAVTAGDLRAAPPMDWKQPTASIVHVSLGNREVDALSEDVRYLGLTGAEAVLVALLAVHGAADRGSIAALICKPDTDSKSVDVAACKARKKLARFAIRIETRWGRGYAMLPPAKERLLRVIHNVKGGGRRAAA